MDLGMQTLGVVRPAPPPRCHGGSLRLSAADRVPPQRGCLGVESWCHNWRLCLRPCNRSLGRRLLWVVAARELLHKRKQMRARKMLGHEWMQGHNRLRATQRIRPSTCKKLTGTRCLGSVEAAEHVLGRAVEWVAPAQQQVVSSWRVQVESIDNPACHGRRGRNCRTRAPRRGTFYECTGTVASPGPYVEPGRPRRTSAQLSACCPARRRDESDTATLVQKPKSSNEIMRGCLTTSAILQVQSKYPRQGVTKDAHHNTEA